MKEAKNIFLKIFLFILKIIGIAIGAFVILLLVLTFTDYKPAERIKLKVIGNSQYKTIDINKKLSFITFNIGYGALGAEADFFLDGGTMSVGVDKEVVLKHIRGIVSEVKKISPDFILFQEVDRNSRRSYYIDEYEIFLSNFKNYNSIFAINYKVLFVPVPITKPMGKVLSGIALFAKYRINNPERYQFPGNYSWPVKVVQLDRCFVITEYKINNTDKKLYVINTHNSAFDKGGFLRKLQMDYLKNILIKLYNNGQNYVIVGGDWNMILPGVIQSKFKYKEKMADVYMHMDKNWTPYGWKWGVDVNTPSNRSVSSPYKKGYNFLTVIDGFLVSPNIDIITVKGINLEFKDSDHNPVYMEIKLKMNE